MRKKQNKNHRPKEMEIEWRLAEDVTPEQAEKSLRVAYSILFETLQLNEMDKGSDLNIFTRRPMTGRYKERFARLRRERDFLRDNDI